MGIGLLLHMHGVATGTQCCYRNTVAIVLLLHMHGVAIGTQSFYRNTVGIVLLLHMHGVAIGTQWALACCFTCMVLP